jgi:hypothetical protein
MTTKCGYMSSKARHPIPWKSHKVEDLKLGQTMNLKKEIYG